jgi:hypothetical protein
VRIQSHDPRDVGALGRVRLHARLPPGPTFTVPDVPIIQRPLEALVVDDLQALIDAAVSESREIEFKQTVGLSDRDKREFLADVSSFANATGGDLLIGIAEKGGCAAELVGVPSAEADATILRLENIIRDGVEPRIPGLHSRAVAIDSERSVIVIRIPRSFAAPHMVSFGGLSRFYSRNSAGKHKLDIGEIRAAFALSDSSRTRLQNFRSERLARITAGETPVALPPNPKTVLHVIPLTVADATAQIDAPGLTGDPQHFRPLSGSAWDSRVNFDGAIAYASDGDGALARSYTQVFRNGAIEGVEGVILRREYSGGTHLIPSLVLERTLIEGLTLYLALLAKLLVEPPYLVGVSLLDVRGHVMALARARESREIDRDDLIVPELLVEDASQPADAILKPAIDAVWQAAGLHMSENYDEHGSWHDR